MRGCCTNSQMPACSMISAAHIPAVAVPASAQQQNFNAGTANIAIPSLPDPYWWVGHRCSLDYLVCIGWLTFRTSEKGVIVVLTLIVNAQHKGAPCGGNLIHSSSHSVDTPAACCWSTSDKTTVYCREGRTHDPLEGRRKN